MFSYISIWKYTSLKRHFDEMQRVWDESIKERNLLLSEKDFEINTLRAALELEKNKTRVETERFNLKDMQLESCKNNTSYLEQELKKARFWSFIQTSGIVVVSGIAIYSLLK